MFNDDTDQIEDDVNRALEIYTLEELLDHNDLTLEEAITILVRDGYFILPEIQVVR